MYAASFAGQQIEDGWSDETLEAGVALNLLAARVGDEEMERLVEAFKEPCVMANFAPTEEEGEEQLLLHQALNALNAAVGRHLARLPPPASTAPPLLDDFMTRPDRRRRDEPPPSKMVGG